MLSGRLYLARWMATTALVGGLMGAMPAAGWAQDTVTPLPPQQAALPPATPPQGAPVFNQAQLQSMLAPIALYPDPLLSQVLMAAAYPDEVAAADQWVHDPANAGLRGDALNAALGPVDWDPSVKSLVPFPQVLDTMAQHMDWTQQLGQAFVVQQPDVMNAVQALRREAEARGNLRPTPQLAVAQAGGVITIEPADPEMLYVPIYDPTVVYGAWAYPIAPVVIYPPRIYAAPIIFSVGFVIVRPLWGWSRCDWVHRDVFVEPARVNVINERLIVEGHRERVADSHWRFDRSRDRDDHDRDHGRPGPAGHAAAVAPHEQPHAAFAPHAQPQQPSHAAFAPHARPQPHAAGPAHFASPAHQPQAQRGAQPHTPYAPHPALAAAPHANPPHQPAMHPAAIQRAPQAHPAPQAHAPSQPQPSHAQTPHGAPAQHGRDEHRDEHR